MLWRSNHIHDRDACSVQPIDHIAGRNSNGANKQLSFFLNDYVNQFGESTLGVVVICFSGSSHFWQQQIDSKRCIFVFQILLEVLDLLPQKIWSVTHPSNNAQAACIGNGGS
eukprot:Lithocolla_globosa_v1_NODE_4313_length_1465_cov_20.626241.p2 type:complete len:112 gc:universal NODE_4313_length_1465_cov_20.626241:982-1317(+)